MICRETEPHLELLCRGRRGETSVSSISASPADALVYVAPHGDSGCRGSSKGTPFPDLTSLRRRRGSTRIVRRRRPWPWRMMVVGEEGEPETKGWPSCQRKRVHRGPRKAHQAITQPPQEMRSENLQPGPSKSQ